MKKLSFFMCMALAAVSLISCSETEDVLAPELQGDKKVIFNAANPIIAGNGTRTEIEIGENGVLTPYWSSDDKLLLCSDYRAINLYRTDKDNNPQRTRNAQFYTTEKDLSRFKYDHYYYGLYCNIKSDGDNFFDVGSKGPVFNNGHARILFKEDNYYIPNDILVTKPTPLPGRTVPEGPFNLQFKRLSALVRLNIINKVNDRSLNYEPFSDALYIMAQHGGKTLGGAILYDVQEDKIIDKKDPSTTYRDFIVQFNDTAKGYVSNHTFQQWNEKGIYKDPMYFSTIPMTIPAGDELKFWFNSRHKIGITKVVKLKEDLVLQPGKITTINLVINPEDILVRPYIPMLEPEPDPSIDPIVEGNTITMRPGHADRMTSYTLLKAMTDGGTVKIKGECNINLFAAVSYITGRYVRCDMKNLTLDLSEVKLKGAPDVMFQDEGIREVRALKDDYMPAGCIRFDNQLPDSVNTFTNIILPYSLKEMDQNAINCKGIKKITIGPDIKRMDTYAVNIGRWDTWDQIHDYMVTFLAPKSPDLNLGVCPFNIYAPVDLTIHESWKDDVSRYGWHGMQRWDVFFVDDKGNITGQSLKSDFQ